MKKIPLTQGKFALVNDEDYDYLDQWKWCADKAHSRNVYYARRMAKIEGRFRGLQMHVQIMSPPKGMMVDHRNGDGLDNRRENLRICTHRQNNLNRIAVRGSSSKYLNVRLRSDTNKWEAGVRIRANGKRKNLGSFETELEAGIIANIAMRKYYGEFARPNKLTKISYEKNV